MAYRFLVDCVYFGQVGLYISMSPGNEANRARFVVPVRSKRKAGSMWRFIGNVLLPGGDCGKLSILIHHRILSAPDPLAPDTTAEQFDWELAILARHFNVLSLGDALTHLRAGSLPPRSVCITFDDGYANNATHALPLLQKYNLTATFFIATGFLNGGMMWNDQIIETMRQIAVPEVDLSSLRGLPHTLQQRFHVSTIPDKKKVLAHWLNILKYEPMCQRLHMVNEMAHFLGYESSAEVMMTDAQVCTLRRSGMEIGGHTVNHPILTKVSAEESWQEMHQGKVYLEKLLGESIRFFAYPNGMPRQDYAASHAKQVAELGFEAALSTAWGVATRQASPLQLPRFTPWDQTPAAFMLRMLRNGRLTQPLTA
jgi:peptidoglycan/xylan/chitin deacetylase (PgdA/CDA1 family)